MLLTDSCLRQDLRYDEEVLLQDDSSDEDSSDDDSSDADCRLLRSNLSADLYANRAHALPDL